MDSTLAVYSGTCGNLVEIGCGEDDCVPNFMSDTGVIAGLTPGETYYLMVSCPGGWGGNVPGPFTLDVTTN